MTEMLNEYLTSGTMIFIYYILPVILGISLILIRRPDLGTTTAWPYWVMVGLTLLAITSFFLGVVTGDYLRQQNVYSSVSMLSKDPIFISVSWPLLVYPLLYVSAYLTTLFISVKRKLLFAFLGAVFAIPLGYAWFLLVVSQACATGQGCL